MNQTHKTLRSYYCEDTLWELFEVMTRDLDCSMDYLINEAMRQYAGSRNYSVSELNQQQAPPAAYPPQPLRPSSTPAVPPPPVRPPVPPRVRQEAKTIPISAPVFDKPGGGFSQSYRPTTPRIPPLPGGSAPPPQLASPQNYSAPPRPVPVPPPPAREQYRAPQENYAAPPPSQQPVPQPAPQAAPQAAPQPAGKPSLYLYFNGQRYLINRERFIVGRGSQGTDLTIRDGNISRKHAAVIWHEGAYFIQDLGSTNGVEFNGTRVEARQINEGDLYNICDYELRFSYQG